MSELHITSAYGLFEVMTKHRPEIVIEGSDDGVQWKAYRFRWKADDDLAKTPQFCTPHMPRLDWQLWFAAMGDMNQSPWTYGLMQRLLEGSPDVLDLFGENPFPKAPPKYVRALTYEYHFTTPAEHDQSGNWWTRGPAAVFCPAATLDDFRTMNP